MNKLVKLPLFLGIAGAACAGILAGVNAITAPIIEQNNLKAENENIYKMFDSYSDLKLSSVEDLGTDLINAGVSKKIIVTADGLNNAVVYSATTPEKGFNGTISFQIAFKDGAFYQYADVSSSETDGFGGTLISNLKNGTYDFGELTASYYFDGMTGASYTSSALRTSINAIVADYVKGL